MTLPAIEELKFLKETTDWNDFKEGQINHTYITYKLGKTTFFVGHIPRGTEDVHIWSQPMMVDKRERTFKEIPCPDFAKEQIGEAA